MNNEVSAGPALFFIRKFLDNVSLSMTMGKVLLVEFIDLDKALNSL
jgi:hypothetical protein